MKKLVIAVLAIGAMAACTKSNIQYEQPEEISFQPVAKKATKAVNGAIDGTTYPTDENFNVWSWWISQNAETPIDNMNVDFDITNTDPDKPILYINEGTFANRKDAGNNPTNTWGGKTTPYYWPTTGSLFFAGYSPAPAEAEAPRGTFNYNFNTQTFTVEGYTQSNDISETVDLMWFDADESYKQNGAVNVTFNHALSWLEFKFKLADDDTPYNWKIKEVTLNGIETKADFSSSPIGWSNYSTEDAYKNQQMTIFTGNKILESSEAGYLSDEGTNERKYENTGVVVIPQSCKPAEGGNLADAELVIEYGLLTPATADKEDHEKVYINQSVTLPLKYSCNTTEHNPDHDGNMWEPGYHYIYTITFGANEILISPSVTEWAVENENIDVE